MFVWQITLGDIVVSVALILSAIIVACVAEGIHDTIRDHIDRMRQR